MAIFAHFQICLKIALALEKLDLGLTQKGLETSEVSVFCFREL
jgi:hypothetical protein